MQRTAVQRPKITQSQVKMRYDMRKNGRGRSLYVQAQTTGDAVVDMTERPPEVDGEDLVDDLDGMIEIDPNAGDGHSEIDERYDYTQPIRWDAARQHWLARLVRFSRKLWANRRNIIPAILKVGRETWHQRPWRERTPEEKYLLEERKRREAERKEYMKDALWFWERIVNALERLGHAHKDRESRFRSVHRVTFDRVGLQPEAVILRVAVDKLPYGVSTWLLKDEHLLFDLSMACGRRVRAVYREAVGFFYIVERSIGLRGIPNHVQYAPLLDDMPSTAGKMAWPLGIAQNARVIYRELNTLPHMLVAGTTGAGKSNFVNVVLLTLLLRNTPKELELLMIDLKGGLEFGHYKDVPHLYKSEVVEDGIIEDPGAVVMALEEIVEIMYKRMKTIKIDGFKDIVDYNARKPANKRMPRMLIVFDELASISLADPTAAKDAMNAMSLIGNMGRAVGIHMIAATQYPNRNVIRPSLKAVMPGQAAFNCSTLPASMTILGTGDAVGLGIVGRFVFQGPADRPIEIQAPYLSDVHRKQLLQKIVTGEDVKLSKQHDVTELAILEWALLEHSGYIVRDTTYEHFKTRGLTKDELNTMLQDMDGKTFRVFDSIYTVVPPAGRAPRKMELQDNAQQN